MSGGSPVTAAFAAAGVWEPVSARLATARRILLALAALAVGAATAAVVALTDPPGWVTALAVALIAVATAWGWWFIGRRVSSMAYCLREHDLLVRSGILMQRLVVVPFGRMQLVDVTAGPLDRWLGITAVQLHTAAATTKALVPGLEPERAAALRDTLARAGESRSAGL